MRLTLITKYHSHKQMAAYAFLFDTVLTIKLALKPEPSTFMNKVIAYPLKKSLPMVFYSRYSSCEIY